MWPPRAQSATGLVIILLGLVEASPRWLVLGLAKVAIAVVDPFKADSGCIGIHYSSRLLPDTLATASNPDFIF